jgi:hypothetical protein
MRHLPASAGKPQRHRVRRVLEALELAMRRVTPVGNADGCENEGVARQESGGQAGKAIRKSMKANGGQET